MAVIVRKSRSRDIPVVESNFDIQAVLPPSFLQKLFFKATWESIVLDTVKRMQRDEDIHTAINTTSHDKVMEVINNVNAIINPQPVKPPKFKVKITKKKAKKK